MRVGTKSILFGVHAFWWHPISVARAWKFIHGRWPRGIEWLAIVVHDWGYWGCRDIDGTEGKLHPIRGAEIAHKLCFWSPSRALDAWRLVRYHSRWLATRDGVQPSNLCWPDKASFQFDPRWWYLFRARLSGEIREYVRNAVVTGHLPPGVTDREWYDWIRHRLTLVAKNKVTNYNEKSLP